MSETIQTKFCPKCKDVKQVSEFYKSKRKYDGLQSWCKSCKKRYMQSAEGKAAIKRYDQSEKGRANTKRYFQSEKGKVANRKATKKYRQTEKGKSFFKQWHLKHPNQIKAKKAVSHAIEAGKLPRADSLQCHYGEHLAQQYHHWHGYEPEHWLDVVPACKKCHTKHHHKILT